MWWYSYCIRWHVRLCLLDMWQLLHQMTCQTSLVGHVWWQLLHQMICQTMFVGHVWWHSYCTRWHVKLVLCVWWHRTFVTHYTTDMNGSKHKSSFYMYNQVRLVFTGQTASLKFNTVLRLHNMVVGRWLVFDWMSFWIIRCMERRFLLASLYV